MTMTPKPAAQEPERCVKCDRADCQKDVTHAAWNRARRVIGVAGGEIDGKPLHDYVAQYERAFRDCQDHAVNWRERALAAEVRALVAEQNLAGTLDHMKRTDEELAAALSPAPPPDAELRAWLASERERVGDLGVDVATQDDRDRWLVFNDATDDALVALIRDAIAATGKRG